MCDNPLTARMSEFCNAKQLGQAARHRHVGLGDVDTADVEKLLILITGRESQITSANRHAITLETCVSGEVVDGQRSLDPLKIILAKNRHEGQSLVCLRPCGRGIHHQLYLVSDMITSRSDQKLGVFQVIAPEWIGHDLDGFQAQAQAAIDVAPNIIGGLPKRIDGAISEDTVSPFGPKELAERFAQKLAAQIP